MDYTTQMDAARRGIVTKEMEAVAREENISIESLMEELAKGTVIIPANKNQMCQKPRGKGF